MSRGSEDLCGFRTSVWFGLVCRLTSPVTNQNHAIGETRAVAGTLRANLACDIRHHSEISLDKDGEKALDTVGDVSVPEFLNRVSK